MSFIRGVSKEGKGKGLVVLLYVVDGFFRKQAMDADKS